MKIPLVHNLRLMQIKGKDYKGITKLTLKFLRAITNHHISLFQMNSGFGDVFNFKIEEFRDYGPVELGKFGR